MGSKDTQQMSEETQYNPFSMGSEGTQQMSESTQNNIFSNLAENTDVSLNLKNGVKFTTNFNSNDSIFLKGKTDITAGWTHSSNDSTCTVQGSVGKDIGLKTQWNKKFYNGGKVSLEGALGKDTTITATYSKNKFSTQVGYDKNGNKYGNIYVRTTWKF